MLDPQGITLAEVNARYPSIFQKLGYDVLLDVDSTYKPKVISTFQMCVNIIITLLLSYIHKFHLLYEELQI